jgi:hypothetical protein
VTLQQPPILRPQLSIDSGVFDTVMPIQGREHPA